MADKKETTSAKNEKKAADSKKKPNVFVRMGRAIKKFFKDVKGECRKVTWPSGKTVWNNSLVVIAVVAIVGLVIFGIDTGLSAIIDGIVSLAEKHNTADMISMFFLR